MLATHPVGEFGRQIRARSLELRGVPADVASDPVQPIVADYSLCAFLDLPGSSIRVNESMLAAWDVDLPTVIRAAMNNRTEDTGDIYPAESAVVVTGVHFSAAVLLSPVSLSRISGAGTPVIIVPEVGTVVVAWAEYPASLASAARLAESIQANSQQLVSATALVRKGNSWTPFTWPNFVTREVGNLQRRFGTRIYADARPLTQQSLALQGRDIYVAECALTQGPDGQAMTVASVSDRPTAVPSVDRLWLVPGGGQPKAVPFQHVAAAGVLEELPIGPVRYDLVTRFPFELL